MSPIIKTEFWVQRKSKFGWDDYSCRMSRMMCLERAREFREQQPARQFRVIERKTKETLVDEMDTGTV